MRRSGDFKSSVRELTERFRLTVVFSPVRLGEHRTCSSQALIEALPKGDDVGVWDSIRAELEEQRCLIEQQQVTIQRQQRKIELQLRLTADMQAELERIQLTLQRVSPDRSPSQNLECQRR